MKSSKSIALLFSLSAALLCGTALADDAMATMANGAPAAKPAHHHHKAAAKAVHGVKYDNCVKEKSAAAEYFCSAHADSCQAEKDGIAKQCKSEARGERQKG
jgi:hypothetical protein